MIHCQTVTLPLFDAGYHGHFDLRASGTQCRHLSDDALLMHIKGYPCPEPGWLRLATGLEGVAGLWHTGGKPSPG